MKKFLLMASVAIMAATTANAQWYVPGVNGDWNFNANTIMTETPAGSGIYQSKEFTTLTTGGFQISQNNYANQKSTADKAMAYDTEYTLKAGGYQMDMNMAEAGEGVVIIYDSNKNTVKVTRKASAVVVYDYYIKGSIFGDSWASHKMTKESDGVYSYTAPASTGEFGCFSAMEGSTSQVDWIAAASTTNITIGTPLAVNIGGGSNIKLSQAGNYKFTLDVNAKTMTVTEVKASFPDELYIIGTVNGKDWASNNGVKMINEGDGIYSIETELGNSLDSGFGYFSFTEALSTSWDTMGTRYGSNKNDYVVVLEEEAPVQVGQNSFKLAAGTYSFTVNLDEKTLYVEAVAAQEPEVPTSISATISGEGSVNWDADSNVLEVVVTTEEDTATVTLAIPEGFTNWYIIDMSNMGGMWSTRAAEDWMTVEDVQDMFPGILGNEVTVAATEEGEAYGYAIFPVNENNVNITAQYYLDITATKKVAANNSKDDFVPVTVTPAEGKVTKLGYVSFKFDEDLELIGGPTAKLYKDDVLVQERAIDQDFVSINNWDLCFVNFSNQTADGVYKVVIPEGAIGNSAYYKDHNEGRYNPELTFTWTIGEVSTGVEAIEAVDANAIYFNVNGVRVANPENGLYIKVVDGKASKVIIK